MHTPSTEISLDHAWNPLEMPPPTSTEDSVAIAPWLADPPSPPPKRSNFGFASVKVLNRQGSSSTIFTRPRASETTLAESFHSASTTESSPRNSKKGFIKSIKHSLSRSNLNKHVYDAPPIPPPSVAFSHDTSSTYSYVPPSPPPLPKKPRRPGKQKPPAALAPTPKDLHLGLPDASIESILNVPVRDIVHPSALEENSHGSMTSTDTTSSPTDFGPETGWTSRFNNDIAASPPRTAPAFTNPFPTSASPARRKLAPETNRTTPRATVLLPMAQEPQQRRLGSSESTSLNDDPASWTAPESWAVPKEGDEPEAPDYTSSEEEEDEPPTTDVPNGAALSVPVKSKGSPDGKAPLPPRKGSHAKVESTTPYKIRIHRYDGAYHVVSCPLDTTVAQLSPVLHRKLLLNREIHKMYLRERGRERLLAPTERPAVIVRRRLEHAGYDAADGLENLGADEIQFLLKFVFKSEQLGGDHEQEIMPDSFEYIDLSGKSLRTVPIVLYQHAPTIVTLNLSKNPLLEIPLDFIQLCETLRELRLCNMAMKKVPQSVRYSTSLQRLDLSCNRIVDLDEAGLELIPGLLSLNVQNNRLERLPKMFRRLEKLRFLNISNNKFEVLPQVLGEMKNLVDLDVSFNTISRLPSELGQLLKLERLVMVGNQVSEFPEECEGLVVLSELDCRRNNIADLSVICRLPRLETLRADHNVIHALDLSFGPSFKNLEVTNNDITRLALVPGPVHTKPFFLTHLDISHAKLSSLDDFALAALTSLTSLTLDYNSFRSLPDVLCSLKHLVRLSCTDNDLDALPPSIGLLQNLISLDAHNNNLTEVPRSIWNCGSLVHINMTSNLIRLWHDPPLGHDYNNDPLSVQSDRKMSSSTIMTSSTSHPLPPLPPPLARSLKRLYLGDNRLEDDVFHPLNLLKELTVLNLSFNHIQEIPPFWLQSLAQIEKLYLSGNHLRNLPSENLYRLTKLTVLFLNGNKLQTLPAELGKVKNLAVLDVGSNALKYNVNNWEFDWNWNFNPQLRYLNLSGNKRLAIKPDNSHSKKYMQIEVPHSQAFLQKQLAEFTGLKDLRVLGLMDVTTLFMPSIPDENEDRRVRTSAPEINGMAYGIADTLGNLDHVGMFDLVTPCFRSKQDECLFGMFGRLRPLSNNNNRLTKFLHENFLPTFTKALDALKKDGTEGVADAMRRAFLALNKNLFDHLTTPHSSRKSSTGSNATGTLLSEFPSAKTGAEAVVVYMVGKTMYVGNVGNALAVVSCQGTARLISTNHDPFDRAETARIRAAEGWVSPKGLVNDEVGVSRSFGYYHVMPAVNPRPDVAEWHLSERDEFVIVGNRGLWDYLSYQTAVDIARNHREDPMIAAQKLRDFAMSYGADGSTMIMVICVADLFKPPGARLRQLNIDAGADAYSVTKRPPLRRKEDEVADRNIARLEPEVEPPKGHVALVFTDIRNSTFLWDKNAGMATAMKLHNNLLRRLLRFTGGYEVKTEGDAFMVSFSNALAAVHWCFMVQVQLLHEPWPLEILECEDGKEIKDSQGRLIARGLSVRMGVHCGMPYCERDPVTRRMDYLGPVVNRAARISQSAAGGQIMCSADVIREITERVLADNSEQPVEPDQATAIDAIRLKGVVIKEMGEKRMKGLEVPELLSLVYPDDLAGRLELGADGSGSEDGSRVQFSEDQMKKLAHLCLRLETLSSMRVFRPLSERKASGDAEADPAEAMILYADPDLLVPSMKNRSDHELTYLLDSFSVRIDNALSTLQLRRTLGAANYSL